METMEFEGRSEQEAIDKAIAALGLNRDEIDVEIVESKKGSFLFGGGRVKIRVHVEEEAVEGKAARPATSPQAQDEFERKVIEFLSGLVTRIGLTGAVHVAFREENKLGLDIETEDSGLLIGKRGSTLEALQLITNIVAGRFAPGNRRVIIDTKDYRNRREKSLIRNAKAVADQVRRTGESRLLEAMNPFERRLVHTALSGSRDIETSSEGEGLYKRIRIQYRGNREGRKPPRPAQRPSQRSPERRESRRDYPSREQDDPSRERDYPSGGDRESEAEA